MREATGRRRGRWEMGQNVMGDVIPGCRDAPGGESGSVLVGAEIEGNMERLTGRRERMQAAIGRNKKEELHQAKEGRPVWKGHKKM